jgi:hypothetical protein
MNLSFWFHHPKLAVARLTYWIWEKRNSDKPWLTPAAVEHCQRHLGRQMRGWEFGSGRSTPWFAQRLGTLVSIEHDPRWFARVKAQLDRLKIINVDYRLIPVEKTDSSAAEAEAPPGYVATLTEEPDDSLDFLAVDGQYRTPCIRAGLRKIRPGGLLLVDDVNYWARREDLPVPETWPVVHESTNGLKVTCIWQKPLGERPL